MRNRPKKAPMPEEIKAALNTLGEWSKRTFPVGVSYFRVELSGEPMMVILGINQGAILAQRMLEQAFEAKIPAEA